MNNVFNIKRFSFLARKDFFQLWRGAAITAGTIAGILLLAGILGGIFGSREDVSYDVSFRLTLLIWGAIAASLAFSELHDKARNEDFLLIPASSLEKVSVRLVWVSVVLPIYILGFITLASLITEGLTTLIFGLPFNAFNPFDGEHWELIGYLIIMQSVFFLGAAWFKKVHLIKTVLTGIVIAILMGFIGGIVFRIVFAGYFEGFFTPINVHIDFAEVVRSRFPALMRTTEVIGKTLFYGLLAPFCWVVAWLRVKETQSSDGI